MSAAEKLGALVEGFFEDTEPSGHEAPVEIIRALPQIVAVVEEMRCRRDPYGVSFCGKCDSCLALAALDEALSSQ